ncbi:MAG: Multicopper oxidase type 3 [Gemmatimonadetes bacterium]|nr:Multicopper oxidase type 3 [Gemmatimonadota bacterium]
MRARAPMNDQAGRPVEHAAVIRAGEVVVESGTVVVPAHIARLAPTPRNGEPRPGTQPCSPEAGHAVQSHDRDGAGTGRGGAVRRRLPGMLVPALLLIAAGAHAQPPRCESSPDSARPNHDLYCVPLIPTSAYAGAAGIAELAHIPTPFGVAVTRDGEHRYRFVLTVSGLPALPASAGQRSYVAWLTTPQFGPPVNLGAVHNGRNVLRTGGFNKFLVLVSLERDANVGEREGPLVMRGMSPSTRMLPEHLPAMLASMAEGAWTAPAGAAHEHSAMAGHAMAVAAPSAAAAWTSHPMHPGVRMLPGLMLSKPAVTPFLPTPPSGATLPLARPRQLMKLRDGDTLQLTAQMVRRTLKGKSHVMYGFNGQYPGPLLEVGEGATIVVRFRNAIDQPTAVHWHGVRLENRFDGVPGLTQEPVPPGGSFEYRVFFRDPGIYWYHPHVREDIQQDLGLFGNMLVRSPDPAYHGPANREEVLMLDDLTIGADGLLPYGSESATHSLMGRFGNVLLVNGEPRYRLAVRQGEVVRFYVTNVSNTRTWNVSFGQARMKVLASDVSRYEREEWVESVVIAPAERYVVDVRFGAAGTVPFENRVQGIDHLNGTFFPDVTTLGTVTVAPRRAVPDHSTAFLSLRAHDSVRADIDRYRPHFDRPVDRELELLLRVKKELPFPLGPVMRLDSLFFNPVEWVGTMEEMNWVATGEHVEWLMRDRATGRTNAGIDLSFRQGDVVKIRLINRRDGSHAMQHPIHFHGQRFLVLSQNGVPATNHVWKDTVLLPVGTTADILLDLSNPGNWMVHCHIAEHLEAGMLTTLRVGPTP